jgi:hypothetical protein
LGVSLSLADLDRVYRTQPHTVTTVNDVSVALASEKEAFNRQIYTRYSGDDLLSNLPTCDCGTTTGEYNLGVMCLECNTLVAETTMQELQPIVWMRAPYGVKSLINPIFWVQISEFFQRSNFDVLRWIADTNYHPIVRTPAVMEAVRAVIPQRGYNYFLENFFWIVETLMELKVYRTPPKRKQAAELLELMRQYRHVLFPQHIPLPNKSLLVIEKSNVGTYIDTTVSGAVDAIRTMTGIDLPETNFHVRVKENRTIKTICQLSDFYIDWASKSLAGKPGVMRKHVCGTRSDFSFRAVISSTSEAHEYDEIYISWGIAVAVFRIHLANKLMMMHWTPNEVIKFLDEHAQTYHPLLAKLLDELIAESPEKGIPVILGRNPSLQRGSTQQLFITRVKHDTKIPTISLSVLVLKSFNADFDGDQVNVSLALDNRTTNDQRTLAPHMSTFDLDEPRHISSSLSFPKPIVSTIAEWMHADEGELTEEQIRRMEALPDAA